MSLTVNVEYEQPGACDVRHAWAQIPEEPAPARRAQLKSLIREELQRQNAVLVSHYYVHPDLQDLAESCGGLVADSLEMARFGKNHPAQTLVVAGVRFMGETAKILSPEKTVLMPHLDATCSLDLGCPLEAFGAFCDQHPQRQVVVYANTSAAVKARADWVVTSGCAVDIVAHLHQQGHKILWGPDKHLGRYVQQQTGADLLLWEGSCIVHDEFKAQELEALKHQYPEAEVLVHPESPAAVIALADVVGSTSAILKAAQQRSAQTFIVATDNGMMHRLRQQNPQKTFLEAPTAGSSATCRSCAHCPWMAMNGLENLLQTLITRNQVITVSPELAQRAQIPIQRMLDFTAQRASTTQAVGAQTSGIVPGIGAA